MCVAGLCQSADCLGDADCSDGDFCNGTEVCSASFSCSAGAPPNCGLPSQCSAPTCDPILGCVPNDVADGTPCDDGVASTVGDQCTSGLCEGSVPTLSVDGIVPDIVGVGGRFLLEVHGKGFAPSTSVWLANGSGPPPRVQWIEWIDSNQLLVIVEVRKGGPRRDRVWDVIAADPTGSQVLLDRGLTVRP